MAFNITQQTARNILNRYKLFARKPARLPLLKEHHRKARLRFALVHKNWTVEKWGTILFSDETKFNLSLFTRWRKLRAPTTRKAFRYPLHQKNSQIWRWESNGLV
jgi:hypothetical protein